MRDDSDLDERWEWVVQVVRVIYEAQYKRRYIYSYKQDIEPEGIRFSKFFFGALNLNGYYLNAGILTSYVWTLMGHLSFRLILLKPLWRSKSFKLYKDCLCSSFGITDSTWSGVIHCCPCLFQKLRSHSQHCPLSVPSLWYNHHVLPIVFSNDISNLFTSVHLHLSPLSKTSSVLLVLQVSSSLFYLANRILCKQKSHQMSLTGFTLVWNPSVTSSVIHSPQGSVRSPSFSVPQKVHTASQGLLWLLASHWRWHTSCARMKSTVHDTGSNLQGRPCTIWLIYPGGSSRLLS